MERAALTLAMLEDVLDAALMVPGWETWVLSPDEAVLEVAATRGAVALVEDEPPLGQAIRQAETEAEGRGADALAVLLPDTPFVTTAVLTRTVHTLGPVVIAPATDERGTNLLLRRPPHAITARFGPDSFRPPAEAPTCGSARPPPPPPRASGQTRSGATSRRPPRPTCRSRCASARSSRSTWTA